MSRSFTGKYQVIETKKFKKDLRRQLRRGKQLDKLYNAVNALSRGEKLPWKYHDHALTGRRQGLRDCHIEPDWVLIYKIDHDKLILLLSETGSHSDLDL